MRIDERRRGFRNKTSVNKPLEERNKGVLTTVDGILDYPPAFKSHRTFGHTVH